MHYSIGIDIGTTTVKCILFQAGPAVCAEASKEYKTMIPRPSWAEQDANDWWTGVRDCIRELIAKSGVFPGDIKVVSVSSQSPCVLALDADGKPLHNALIWMDRRSTKEMEELKETIGDDRIYEITGNRLDTYFMLPELVWMMRHHPEVIERCHKLVQVNGYINTKLTGTFTIDEAQATLTEVYDCRKGEWSDEIIKKAGIPREILPDLVNCGDVIGNVTAEAARETGLTTDCVVLAGMTDANAAVLEVDATDEGTVSEMTGTSSVVMIPFESTRTERNLAYLRGLRRGTTILFGAMNAVGGSLKWFRDTLYGGETAENDAYDRINKEIEAGTKGPSGIIFLPYLSGERSPIWDSHARGVFAGISMNTSRAEVERAIMEGGCFALQDNLKQVEEEGIPIKDFICCGGCTKSEIWLKIKASVIDKEIRVPAVNLGAPGGLACVHAAYLKEYDTPEEAARATFRIGHTVEPVKEWVAPYAEMFGIYRASYRAMKEQFEQLAKLHAD